MGQRWEKKRSHTEKVELRRSSNKPNRPRAPIRCRLLSRAHTLDKALQPKKTLGCAILKAKRARSANRVAREALEDFERRHPRRLLWRVADSSRQRREHKGVGTARQEAGAKYPTPLTHTQEGSLVFFLFVFLVYEAAL